MTRAMNKMKWLKWITAIVVIAALAIGVSRALLAKKIQREAAAALAAKPTQSAIELARTDVVQVKSRDLAEGLAISGALKAANSVFIKARVAGELQDLTAREGDWVKLGQIVAKVDPTDSIWRIKQAQEQADAAKTQIDIAQRSFDNNRSLVEQGFISKTALDTSSSQLLGAQATHKASLAGVEMAKKSLDDTILRSPISGQVAQRLAQPGERVAVDGRVLEIVDLSRIELEASLSAGDSVNVKLGQTATLQIEGVPNSVAATVVRINPSAQAASRSVIAYLAINPAGLKVSLRQGLFAQGLLGTGKQNGLSLPVTAIRTDKPSPYVQLIENGRVVHRSVQPGLRGESDGELMVILAGLPDGVDVLRGSVGQLREGTQVKFTPDANANPNAESAPAKAGTVSQASQ